MERERERERETFVIVFRKKTCIKFSILTSPLTSINV